MLVGLVTVVSAMLTETQRPIRVSVETPSAIWFILAIMLAMLAVTALETRLHRLAQEEKEAGDA